MGETHEVLTSQAVHYENDQMSGVREYVGDLADIRALRPVSGTKDFPNEPLLEVTNSDIAPYTARAAGGNWAKLTVNYEYATEYWREVQSNKNGWREDSFTISGTTQAIQHDLDGEVIYGSHWDDPLGDWITEAVSFDRKSSQATFTINLTTSEIYPIRWTINVNRINAERWGQADPGMWMFEGASIRALPDMVQSTGLHLYRVTLPFALNYPGWNKDQLTRCGDWRFYHEANFHDLFAQLHRHNRYSNPQVIQLNQGLSDFPLRWSPPS